MSHAGPTGLDSIALLGDLSTASDRKACCAAIYENPAVGWLLDDELHPGGIEATRRALSLAGISSNDRVLDVASGNGASAMLAAHEFGCEVVGLEYGTGAVDAARVQASAMGLEDRVRFETGDAEALPFEDSSFDLVLCECSLCTFPDKPQAAAEFSRVMRPGGRLVLCDVVVDAPLPRELSGPLAVFACVGAAMSSQGLERLLADAGLRVSRITSNADDAADLARRIHERLRGARLLGFERLPGAPMSTREAIELVARAQRAIEDGVLGYSTFIARRPGAGSRL